MTWRFAIIRTSPGEYALHSVHLDKVGGGSGGVSAYGQAPVSFDFGEATPFYGDDAQARAHMIALLTVALQDAKSAPILEFGASGIQVAVRI